MKRVAVITGAAKGLGLALSRVCMCRDMHVFMVDNDAVTLKQVVEPLADGSATPVVCDVSNEQAVIELADVIYSSVDNVDLLINNAGVSGDLAPIWELPTSTFSATFQINTMGVLHGIKAFMPRLIMQKNASHIVNIASVFGLINAGNTSAYALSKHGVVSLSESLYYDISKAGYSVSVSVACPSFINTSLIQEQEANPFATHMSELLKHAKHTDVVADSIMRQVDEACFYILPDMEVKGYLEEKLHDIMHQRAPKKHVLAKLIEKLEKRIDGALPK